MAVGFKVYVDCGRYSRAFTFIRENFWEIKISLNIV